MKSNKTVLRTVAAAAASLLLGTGAAIAQTSQVTINLSADGGRREIWRGETTGSKAAFSLDRGDVSAGDSRRDLIIGAPGWNTNTGRVYVHFAGPVRGGTVSLALASAILSGAASGDQFGYSTAAGYVTAKENGSPTPQRDLVVGAPGANSGAGAVYLFNRGLTTGTYTAAGANLIITGAPAGAQLGYTLATGDLDGDDYREIIIGAPGAGAVYVVKGGPALPATLDLSVPSSAFFKVQGSVTDGVGRSLAAGDLSQHKVATPLRVIYDVAIGAPLEDSGKGAVYILRGRTSNTFAATVNLTTDSDVRLGGIDNGDNAGAAMTVALFDSDNSQDLIIGAAGGDGPTNARAQAGEAYVMWGSSSMASKSLSAADVIIYGAAAGNLFGSKMAFGNIDRNGEEDIVVVAPGAGPNGELHAIVGRSRAGFGSVYDLATRAMDRRLIGDPAAGQIQTTVVFAHDSGNWEDIVAGMPDTAEGSAYISFSPELSDTNEPNGTQGGAVPVAPSVGTTSYIFSTGDVDYYQVQFGRDTHLRLQLDVPNSGDFTLELLNVSGTVLKTSDSAGGGVDEDIITTVPAQTYFIRITGRDGSYSQSEAYVLRVLLGPFTDAFEPNNGSGTAVSIGTMPLLAKVFDTEDVDWYKFTTTGTGTVGLALTVPGAADLQMELSTAAGAPVATSAINGNGAAENISVSLAAGDYRIRISAQGAASSTANYTLAVTGGTVATPQRSSIVLGQGPMTTGNGGWFMSRNAADNGFGAVSSTRLPWGSYNNAGGSMRVATGDLDADGRDEVVVSLGAGGDGYVAIFDDASTGYALLTWLRVPWAAYIASNGGETFPAVGDLDADGYAEIVLGLGAGGQGWYAIFDDAAHGYAFLQWKQVDWATYNTSGQGVVHPAIGDLDGDGVPELVLGLGTGSQGWIQIVNNAKKGYSHNRWIQSNWMAYNNANGTVWPAVGDIDGDGRGEIVVGLGSGSDGWFQIIDDASTSYAHVKWQQVPWPTYNSANGTTYPAIGNIDGDPAAEIVFGFAEFGTDGPWFQILDDGSTGYAHLAWRSVGFGKSLFPAIAAMR